MPISKDDRIRGWLATIILVAFGVYVCFITIHKLEMSDSMMGVVVGYVASNAQSVVQYYFGSSSGSAHKSELLQQQGKPG